MSQPDGGPAFPIPYLPYTPKEFISMGMSLRDWFSGMALQGILASHDGDWDIPYLTATAWQMADAMLKHRETHP